MKLQINGREVSSVDISAHETAWPIAEAENITSHFKGSGQLILGGDILTDKLEHSYDSWYYDRDQSADSMTNIDRSAETAREYISNYIKHNGTEFYVVFVTEGVG